MAWYAEKGVYEKDISSLKMEVLPIQKFDTYDDAIEWFNKHLKESVAIWFSKSDRDKNEDPAGKSYYETKSFKKFYELFVEFNKIKSDIVYSHI